MSKVYENVFLYGKFNDKLCIREYDTETKKVQFLDNIPSEQYVPKLFSTNRREGFIPSSKITFESDAPLFEKSFNKMSDLRKLSQPEKATDEENELRELEEPTEEQEERLAFLRKMRKEVNDDAIDDLYGNPDRIQQCIRDRYPDAIENDHEMHTIWIDIETRSGVVSNGFPHSKDALEEVTVIQMYCSKRKEFFISGTKPWTGTYNSRFGPVNYIKYKDEKELLNGFISFIEKDYPAIMIGFNTKPFDFPYLVNRVANVYSSLDISRLSPVGQVNTDIKMKTQDDQFYLGCDIRGLHLADQRDLILKYSFLTLASFSLESVAGAYDLSGKSKQTSYDYQSFDGNYTGNGWVKMISDLYRVPEDEQKVWRLQDAKNKNKTTWSPKHQEALEQEVYNTFMDYSIRDVEVMLEIEEKSKLIGTAKMISYICGVNIVDVNGTYKQWLSYTFNDAFSDGRILPLTQKNSDNEAIYKAGWTTSKPGIHKYVLSTDYASLYPNIFQSFNIGADAIIPENELPQELLDIRNKYFDFFTYENFYNTAKKDKESEEHWQERIKGKQNGLLINKYGDDSNDIPEEKEFYWNLLQEDFSEILRKYNVSVTLNGYFYSNKKQSYTSRAMENNIQKRYTAKYSGIKLAGELEAIKKELEIRNLII